MWFTGTDIKAIEELESGSDRSAAIIACALVDARLSAILRRVLHRDDDPYSSKIRYQVFEPEGPLGSFSAKAKIFYLLKLLSLEAHQDLSLLIKMRNDFAHYSAHDSFESQSMKDRCFNLKLVDKLVRGPAAWWGGQEIDSMSSGETEAYVALNLVDHKSAKETARGRYISTAKLFVAACFLFDSRQSADHRTLLI